MVGPLRKETTDDIMKVLSDVTHINEQFDENLLNKTQEILQENNNSSSTNVNTVSDGCCREPTDLSIVKTIPAPETYVSKSHSKIPLSQIAADVQTKKEEANNIVKSSTLRNTKFTKENIFLRQGIERYGKGAWSSILKDIEFKFHSSRNRDSLRMRAETATFKRHANL